MKVIQGGVCAAKGFFATGISSGIKKSGLDLALVFTKSPAIAAGTFTKNIVKAAPVVISQKRINNTVHAIISNSGNANCCSGKSGMDSVIKESEAIAKALGISKDSILVCSTGIIGKPLPVEKIVNAVPELVSSLAIDGNELAKKAIMTTDTFPKEVAVEINIGGNVVRIGGMAKGAGMIHPDMATMLSFVTTDALIEKTALKKALKLAVDNSFNSITVDGDTSTNDTVLLLANGQADNKIIKIGSPQFKEFFKALNFVAVELAKLIAKDGEGATKFVTINVSGAKTDAEARRIGRFVSISNLLKCAIYGQDPNWGRVAAKAGSSGVKFDINKLDIYIGRELVLSKGTSNDKADKSRLEEIFRQKNIDISIKIGNGKGKATCYTCDLTEEYIKINAAYE